MKICIAGKNNIAVEVCAFILEIYDPKDILIIPNRGDDGIDKFQRSLLKFAKFHNLSVVTLEDIYSIDDLIFLSLEFDRIIIPGKFKTKKLFNIHFSLLPEYKGMYTSVLPILDNKAITGVTLHCIDSGIDTGDIIAQKEIPILSHETSKSLYLKYIYEGVNLVVNNIDLILSGKYISFPQKNINSSYFSKKTINFSSIIIDLNATAWQIYKQICAFNFRDYQLPNVMGYDIVGGDITTVKSTLKPGILLEDKFHSITISTIDYNIILYKDKLNYLIEMCMIDDLNALLSVPNIKSYMRETERLHGWNLLIISAYHNSINILKYLVENGFDINSQNFNGTTAIMYAKNAALKTGDWALIRYMLSHKANPYLQDYSGKNLFDYLENESNELYTYIKNYD
ncbi:formyltransferase family protein [uncultured Bacteroides sp.]|uniref:formyltransferase family protein n=1 Tax=uncultured Bacteroides sp. TaxID=162156 RepID=UPI002AABC804|nr:formyltransferase family protein [uncultured Bacteroides sp.]